MRKPTLILHRHPKPSRIDHEHHEIDVVIAVHERGGTGELLPGRTVHKPFFLKGPPPGGPLIELPLLSLLPKSTLGEMQDIGRGLRHAATIKQAPHTVGMCGTWSDGRPGAKHPSSRGAGLYLMRDYRPVMRPRWGPHFRGAGLYLMCGYRRAGATNHPRGCGPAGARISRGAGNCATSHNEPAPNRQPPQLLRRVTNSANVNNPPARSGSGTARANSPNATPIRSAASI
ncbi:hypothetical protein a10_05476 [Streptomyces acidiscabies]|nr:hypothetical protein a10_05476 [Streptomyces acidiscabies]